MKLVKKLWDMCGTENGSCQILCILITLVTSIQLHLNIIPDEFGEIVIALNAVLWFFTYMITNDN